VGSPKDACSPKIVSSQKNLSQGGMLCFGVSTKTSALLLAAGIVISTANFLTDGAVVSHHTALADAWPWAQTLEIDSSLGMVFMNAFQSENGENC